MADHPDEPTGAEIDAALARGAERAATEPRAVRASYQPAKALLRVRLDNGGVIEIPAANIETLADATPEERADLRISGGGFYLEFSRLPLALPVAALLAGQFGSRRWMDTLRARGATAGRRHA